MALDKRYRDDLNAALRWRDLSKQQINEVLAEAEAHVTETGEAPEDAFGSPRQYADEVAEQARSTTTQRGVLEGLGSTLLICVLGFFGVRYGIDGLDSEGFGVLVTVGDLASSLALPVVLGTAGFLFVRGLGTPLHRSTYFLVALLVLLVGGPVTGMMWGGMTEKMFEIPDMLALILGIAFLVTTVVVGALLKLRRDRLAPR